MRRKCREKKGAALLVAVFLMLLLLVLSVSLLLGAYSSKHCKAKTFQQAY